MNTITYRKLHGLLTAFSAVLVIVAGLSVPAVVRADDTEVFFPPATTSGGASGVNPNILFVIDTSGSMDSDDGFTDADGNPLSRLRRVQIAFRQIVNEFGSNVNIGVERFSNQQGGPILFPVSPIDSTPFGSTISMDVVEAGSCANEAEQNNGPSQPTRCSGAGTSYSLRLGTDYDKIYEQGDFRDEAEEWAAGIKTTFGIASADTNPANHLTDAAASGTGTGSSGRCSDDLDLTYERNNNLGNLLGDFLVNTCQGYSLSVLNSALGVALPGDQHVGIRFPNVDVPISSSTSVRYASLTLTDNGRNSAQSPTINVFGEKVNSSAQFTGAPNTSGVSLRARTTNSYVWQPAAGALDTPFFSATAVPSSTNYNNTASNSNLKDVLQEIINYKQGLPNTTSPAPAGTACPTGSIYGPACYPVTLVMKGPNTTARSSYGIYNGTAAGTAINKRPKLAVVYDGGSYNNLMTGVRFQNVRIPRGTTVTRAYIEFHNAETVDDRDLTIQINAESAGNSAAFITQTGATPDPSINNLMGRTLTSANVSWATTSSGTGSSNQSWMVPYGAYRTPNLKNLVNEVTARGDWCGGNSMTFLFQKTLGDAGRNAVSANMNPAYAPTLHIELDSSQTAYVNGCMNQSGSNQISVSTDDAQEKISSGSVATAGTVLGLGCSGTTKCPGSNSTYVGTRFPNISIPQGATIQSAVIDFTANGGDTSASSLTIRGENIANSATFSTANSNISNRRSASSTSATVSWAPGSWTDGTVYSTPDLKTILQEMVSRSDWTRSSAATFIFEGSGSRRAYSVDGSAGNAPKLRITFQGGQGGNTATTVRQYLPDLVDSFSADGYTPTVGAMYEAARYFRGENAYYGRTRGGGYVNGDKTGEPTSDANLLNVSSDMAMIPGTPPHPLPSGCTTGNYKSSACASETWPVGDVTYQSPITDGCQSNNIVLLSDGFPNNGGTSDGNTTAVRNVQNMIGKSCNTYRNSQNVSQPDWTCGPDIAYFLNNTDQIPSTASASGSYPGLTGSQTVKTYTIGFGADVASGGSDSNGAEFLNKMSQSGGGQYFSAQSSASLVQVFRSIVANILNINTTFVAPAVTVNTFNQLTDRNELYFAVFKPGTNVDWRGNLKRYQIAQPDPTNAPAVYDNTAAPQGPLLAVDTSTGFFKDGTKSFWSPSIDGADVAKGGAASVLTTPRNVYTYIGAIPAGGVTLSGVASQQVQASNTTLNPADTASAPTIAAANARLGLPATADNGDRTNVLNWAAGLDVNDDNGNGVTNEARLQLGDPLHSEPVLITYGTASNSPAPPAEPIPDIALFMGTNDGALHAFNSQDGSEYFSFYPQELLPNLNAYFSDAGAYQNRPYGMDGSITAWVNDANGNEKILNNGTVEAGEFAYIYAGMRRGGRSYYALDVTNRAAPKLKFQITGGAANTSYVELGQTWSKAIKARIRVTAADTAARDVLIFTGGYDPNVDAQQNGAVQPDSQGRALYVADANSGALLWWAGYNDTTPSNTIHPNLAVPQMIYSVPSSPEVKDMDGDGEVDRIYIADAGGQIFRFILNQSSSGVRSLADATVQYVAKLSGTTVLSAHRFYGTPATAVITQNTASPFVAIAIGSGFREHPLETDNEDRFYVIRDPDVSNGTGIKTVANAARTIKDIVNTSSTPYVSQSTEGTSSPDLYDATANYVATTCAATDTACQNGKTAAVSALGTASASGSAKGYYIRLLGTSGTTPGEKVLGPATIVNGVAIYSTFEPGSNATAVATCSAVRGTSRIYYINLVDGSPAQDRDGDGVSEASDRAQTISIGGLPPNPVVITPSVSVYIGSDGQSHVCTGSNCISSGNSGGPNKCPSGTVMAGSSCVPPDQCPAGMVCCPSPQIPFGTSCRSPCDSLVFVGAQSQCMQSNHWSKYSWRRLEN